MCRQMIKTSLCFLTIAHILITFYCTKIISSGTLIISLYILNILPALIVLQREYFPDMFDFDNADKFFIIKHLNVPFDSLKRKTVRETTEPNLYIQRWRKQVLNPAMQFPLDRLAYLKAKYHCCESIKNFWVQNSHLKQLVRKEDYRPDEVYEDDPHPCKMVNDLSEAYIHRRAHLYSSRKTTIVDRKQTTAHRKRRFTMSTIFQAIAPARSPNDSTSSKTLEVQESIPTIVEEDSFESEEPTKARRPSMWKRFSRAFRRSSSVTKSENKKTDYEEYHS